MSLINFETKAGEEITVNNQKITPLTKVLSIRWPGNTGAFIWNHPAGIAVESSNGDKKVLPIQDISMQTILSIAVFTGFISLMIVVLTGKSPTINLNRPITS